LSFDKYVIGEAEYMLDSLAIKVGDADHARNDERMKDRMLAHIIKIKISTLSEYFTEFFKAIFPPHQTEGNGKQY